MQFNVRWQRARNALFAVGSRPQLTVLFMNLSVIALVMVGTAGKRWG
jgi:hypothetical protein